MKIVLLLGSIVLFIVAAIAAFSTSWGSLDTTLGLGFVGLAAFAGSFVPFPPLP